MSRPKLLDLFCCEGGAAVGYHRAGFDVFGVDLFKHKNAKGRIVGFSQSRYPFPSHQGDAIEYVLEHGHRFDAIHASPPCQDYSRGTAAIRAQGRDTGHKRLIAATRDALNLTGRPWVIENVEDARSELNDPIELCGCMFDLKAVDDDGITLHLQRVRLFESNVPLFAPGPHDHSEHEWVGGCYGGARRDKYEAKYVRKGGYVPPNKKVVEAYMGIDWMTWGGLHQSIPPAYTEYIGAQLIDHLGRAAA